MPTNMKSENMLPLEWRKQTTQIFIKKFTNLILSIGTYMHFSAFPL